MGEINSGYKNRIHKEIEILKNKTNGAETKNDNFNTVWKASPTERIV